MTIFCFKTLTPPISLGERLRRRREERGYAINDLEKRTHLPIKYLLALENGRYDELPKARGLRLAYLREYAETLNLDPRECAEQLTNEEGLEDAKAVHPQTLPKHWPFASLSLVFRNLLLGGLAIFFAGYLGWQIKGVLEPPRLAIFAPYEGEVTNQLSTVIQGETTPESVLKINGQEIMVSEQGRFETKIDLASGVNTITLVASKKHGKTTTITRHVVVRAKPG